MKSTKQSALTCSIFACFGCLLSLQDWPSLIAIILILSKGSKDLILYCLLKVQFVEKDMKMFIPLFLNKVLCVK